MSLWEIMKVFDVAHFTVIIEELLEIAEDCELLKEAGQGDSRVPDGFKERAASSIQQAYSIAARNLMASTFEVSQMAQMELDSISCDTYSAVRAQVKRVVDAIRYDLELKKFVSIDESYRNHIDNPLLFGEAVANAFQSARDDIAEAGNCMATGCNTAAVFHLMRVVEWGLRALCVDLGVLRIRRSRKPGQKKYVSIEYAQWERMLDEVHDRVERKINKLAPGKKKQELQEFYYPLLRDLRGFKDAFRNHVMHSRKAYTEKTAGDVFDHVKRFMSQLATKVSEV
jgi:hypothetical protein